MNILLKAKTDEIVSADDVVCLTIIGPTMKKHFTNLIAKGLNTYDQAHPLLKEMYDLLEHGRVLQDYKNQGLKRHND